MRLWEAEFPVAFRSPWPRNRTKVRRCEALSKKEGSIIYTSKLLSWGGESKAESEESCPFDAGPCLWIFGSSKVPGQLQPPRPWQQPEQQQCEGSLTQQVEGWGWPRQTSGSRWDTREQQSPKPEIQQLGIQQEGAGGGQGAGQGAGQGGRAWGTWGAWGAWGGHLGGHLGRHLAGSWHFCWFCWQDILEKVQLL